MERPGRLLSCLTIDARADRCREVRAWLRLQMERGALSTMARSDEEAALFWIEEKRERLLRESVEELESLRTYRATAEGDIHKAVQYINGCIPHLRFSHI